MIVSDPNVIVGGSSLSNIEILEDHTIKLTVRNGATLTLAPKVEDGKVTGYEMVYLTGKENRQIVRMQEKIAQLQSEIQNIKITPEQEDEQPEDEQQV